MKIKSNLSPNFSKKKRKIKAIKFVVIHYTGMQSEIESLNRLTDPKSKVSCHYLINRKGEVTRLMDDNRIAWHAGRSKWKNFNNLNSKSIGIELVNKGTKFGYQNFSKLQIKSLIIVCKKLKKKYHINQNNFLGHSDIAPLRKNDPGKKFPWKKLSAFKIGTWYKLKKTDAKFIDVAKVRNSFFKNLYKIGYRYFNLKKSVKRDKLVVKAFQQRYLPKNVTGRIDKKTMKISQFLSNS